MTPSLPFLPPSAKLQGILKKTIANVIGHWSRLTVQQRIAVSAALLILLTAIIVLLWWLLFNQQPGPSDEDKKPIVVDLPLIQPPDSESEQPPIVEPEKTPDSKPPTPAPSGGQSGGGSEGGSGGDPGGGGGGNDPGEGGGGGGGSTFPNAGNTGPVGCTSYTQYSGTLDITTPGTTLNCIELNGTLSINADNVTVQNSILHGNSWWGVRVGNTKNDTTDFRLLHSRLETTIGLGPDNGGYDYGISQEASGYMEIAYNDISGYKDGVTISGGWVHDNYIHNLSQFVDAHTQDIYVYAGPLQVKIDHNTLINDSPQRSCW